VGTDFLEEKILAFEDIVCTNFIILKNIIMFFSF
jgi:hypothetical protein